MHDGGGQLGASKYEVFSKVAELGSLTQAAEVLGYTQPGISHIISGMEEEYGFPLLIRGRHGVKLTADGARLLPVIRNIIGTKEQLAQVVSAIQGMDAGSVRVGAFTSVAVQWLPGMIKAFQAQYPNIEFGLWGGDYHDMETWLVDAQVDMSFVTLPLTGTLANSCECIPLHEDRLLAVLPKDHPLAGLDVLPLAEIEKLPFIGLLDSSNHDLRHALKPSGVVPNIRFSIKDDHAVIAMVEQGLGISIMPELLLNQYNADVRCIPLETNPSRIIGLAVASGVKASPCIERFAQFVKEWIFSKYGALPTI